jgi:hypothetical protein
LGAGQVRARRQRHAGRRGHLRTGHVLWLTPPSQTGSSRFNEFAFLLQSLAPIGYTLCAVALGIFAGTIWDKVLPAMAISLAGFVGLRIALTVLARPRYLPVQTLTPTR